MCVYTTAFIYIHFWTKSREISVVKTVRYWTITKGGWKWEEMELGKILKKWGTIKSRIIYLLQMQVSTIQVPLGKYLLPWRPVGERHLVATFYNRIHCKCNNKTYNFIYMLTLGCDVMMILLLLILTQIVKDYTKFDRFSIIGERV